MDSSHSAPQGLNVDVATLAIWKLMLASATVFCAISSPSVFADPGIASSLDWQNPFELDPSRNCGPACLTFLENYFEGSRTYKEVAKLCPPSDNGTSLADLQQAADQLGYHTLPFNATVDQLKRMPYRAILHSNVKYADVASQRGSLNHFVVVLSWDEQKGAFRVFDPPKRLRYMDVYEAKDILSGMGLIVSKTQLPPLEEVLAPAPVWPFAVTIVGFAMALILAATAWKQRGVVQKEGKPIRWQTMSAMLSVALLDVVGCGHHQQFDPQNEYDAGTVVAGNVIEHTFRVYNPSDETLHYKRITGT